MILRSVNAIFKILKSFLSKFKYIFWERKKWNYPGKFIWKWLENQIECLSTTALQIFLILRTIHKKLKKRKEFNYNPFIGLWKMFMMKEWECYLRWKKKAWKNDDVKNDWILKFAKHFSIFHTTSIKYLRNFSQLLLRQFSSTKLLLKNSSQFFA